MQRFKRIILPMQGHNKSDLHWLYNTEWKADSELEEKEKIFSYGAFRFWFSGTSHRNSEKLLLYIEIPSLLNEFMEDIDYVPAENYLLKVLAPILNTLSAEYCNTDKNIREKAQFSVQEADELMLRKSGIHYDYKRNVFVLLIHFNVPLVNALSVNAKATVRAVKGILNHIQTAISDLDKEELSTYISCYRKQLFIREYLKRNRLCAFVANGSILPRENGTTKPMKNAVPFLSPKELELTISFEDGCTISGMGLRCGVTVITGGGYSGKSTLLDAIETGVYNHVPSDGREYVITDSDALKIYAEDGRPVHSLDLSPFFRHLPNETDVKNFSTPHASGSVSQAANIIEAVCGGAKLLLIDEDKSATNFMIRDSNMRFVVKNEPIIPFTDRVRELYREKQISTILVIGGSSEYLAYADQVILMEDYLPHIITDEIKQLPLSQPREAEEKASWATSRRLIPKETTQPFMYVRNVKTENEKKIILDEHIADITHLTAITGGNQMNMLAFLCEKLLCVKNADEEELLALAENHMNRAFDAEDTSALIPETAQRFYEEIRPIEVYNCLNRMRGLRFTHEIVDKNE